MVVSVELSDASQENRSSVQVGDPFMEKLLLEACLELIKTGIVVGMQDMGAAGIICSTSEMSEKGGNGMRIDLDKVPFRQQNIKAWEILLSESQERMLVCVKKGREKALAVRRAKAQEKKEIKDLQGKKKKKELNKLREEAGVAPVPVDPLEPGENP